MKSMITKATPLSRICELAPPCGCNACSHGCTVGSGFLATDDIKKISDYLGISEQKLKEKFLEEREVFNTKLWKPMQKKKEGKQYGECVFHNEKGCSVHNVKPMQCRLSTGCRPWGKELNTWFMLNYAVNHNDPESIRQYAIYLQSGGEKIVGGELNELIADESTLKKMLNFEILR